MQSYIKRYLGLQWSCPIEFQDLRLEESTITYYIYRSQKAWAVSYDAQNSTCGTTGEQTKQNTWFLLGRNSLLGKMEHICIGCNVRTFLSKDLILQMETLSYDELKTEK